ncbi:MAG: hypothetical protein AB7V18_04855 [Pyrinomonadaceae bacterium]|jgi:hypothetical protein
MQTTLSTSTNIPTALPDIEADEDREKLLLEDQKDTADDELYADDRAAEDTSRPRGSRVVKILKGVAAFIIFLLLMGAAITWFFGMGWFSKPKPEFVNRTGQRDVTSAPMTEDEKLRAALTMVASKEPNITGDSLAGPAGDVQIVDSPETISGNASDIVTVTNSRPPSELPVTNVGAGFSSQEMTKRQNEPPNARSTDVAQRHIDSQAALSTTSIEPLGRSLFFGVTKPKTDSTASPDTKPTTTDADARKQEPLGRIPFGTLLPVRLLGAIYTLRNSGGVVRMELTQPIEGKGYSYPAGTTLIGNVRGGESVRAFVTVVGLIDPVSGEFVRVTGELMGTDGASGISGERKRITGKWTRFFRGLKDTAGSLLGSVGSLRSGGTVILSEPLRRGSEKLSEDTSQSIFGNEREDTFLEVLAGTSGYVLVTQLPEASTSPLTAISPGVEKE